MCTEAVVSQAVKNLLALLQETGIADEDGVIRDPERLFATDEKGLSERSDSVSRGVVARHQARRASALTGSTTFEHITLTSFVPLSGRRYPVGVIVSTSRERQSWQDLKGLEVRANRGDGTTSAILAEFTNTCLAKPAREHIAPDKAIVLLLDSGGGSWVHLSGAFLRTCLQANVKPFYLPAWTTKALMPCDMNIHETMARVWREFKQAWGLKRLPLSFFRGIESCHRDLRHGAPGRRRSSILGTNRHQRSAEVRSTRYSWSARTGAGQTCKPNSLLIQTFQICKSLSQSAKRASILTVQAWVRSFQSRPL